MWASADGLSLENGPIERDGEIINTWAARFELCDDATCRYFHAQVAQTDGDGQGQAEIRDSAIAQLTAHVCLMAGRLLERAGYRGAVEVLTAVVGSPVDAVSAVWRTGAYMRPPGARQTIRSADIRDHVRVPVSKLVDEPAEVARKLMARLLRTVRPEYFPDPLDLAE